MRNFMGHHATHLIIIRSPQQTHCHIELAIAGISSVNFVLIDYTDPNFVEPAGMIHRLDERYRHASQPIRLPRVDPARRWIRRVTSGLPRRAPARWCANLHAARYEQKDANQTGGQKLPDYLLGSRLFIHKMRHKTLVFRTATDPIQPLWI